jgi:transposase
MRLHGLPKLAREGQGPRPARKRNQAPPTRRLASPRPPRDWAATNRSLVARGDIELWVDPRMLERGRLITGRGRPYHPGVIQLACVVSALLGLPLRQTEGFCHVFARQLGLEASVVPCYSTICRRRRSLSWPDAPVRAGTVLAIDATGISSHSRSEWMRLRVKDPRKTKFVKLHAGIDQATGEVLAFEVTQAEGRGTGDVSVGPRLIRRAGSRGGLCAVLADRAYDARSCYDAAERHGGQLITPPKNNARRGTHPHRDEHLAQIGALGPPEWKRRVGYGQRAQVEGFFACFKRINGGRVRATTLDGQRAEIAAQLAVWNAWHR